MKIIICGATGTIGQQTIRVISKYSDCELVGIVYGNNIKDAKKILFDYKDIKIFSNINSSINNVESFEKMIDITKPNLIINAVSGFAGLEITNIALSKKINLGLANKESLVLAGWYFLELSKINNVSIFPIDSEHSSIWDIVCNTQKEVKSILITASGGKYFLNNNDELENVCFNDVIKHPIWKMGYKISIDSSTLMNKCYEIIEAFYLFKIKNIKAIYHPEVIVHGIVQFTDNSFFANMYNPSMKISIQLCIEHFFKKNINKINLIDEIDFTKLTLNFAEINPDIYKPIKWAIDLISNDFFNKAIAVVLVSSNDFAIELFKKNKIKYLDIIKIIEKSLIKFSKFNIKNLGDIYLLNDEIKKFVMDEQFKEN